MTPHLGDYIGAIVCGLTSLVLFIWGIWKELHS